MLGALLCLHLLLPESPALHWQVLLRVDVVVFDNTVMSECHTPGFIMTQPCLHPNFDAVPYKAFAS